MRDTLQLYSTTATGIGNIPKGAISFGVLNTGAAAGTFNGVPLPANGSINLQAPDGNGKRWTFPRLDFDATGTTFVITAIYYPG